MEQLHEKSPEDSIITITDKTTTSISVEWEAPSDDSIEYTATIRPMDDESGREYLISVLALSENDKGESRCIKQYTKVRPPDNVEVTPGTDVIRIDWIPPDGDVECVHINESDITQTTMQVEWEPPAKGEVEKYSLRIFSYADISEPKPNVTVDKANITTNSLKVLWDDVIGDRDKYRVSIFPPDSDKSERLIIASRINKGETLSEVFENLTPGTMYRVTAAAIMGENESEGYSIEQRTKPDSPKLRSSEVVNEQTYAIGWDHSKGEFDKYELTVKATSNGNWVPYPHKDLETENNNIIVDIVPGIKYDVSLWAVSGKENSLKESTTIIAWPSQPLDVKVVPTETDITVTWKEPAGAKSGYLVNLWSPKSKRPEEYIKHGKQLEICFMKCIQGREYKLSISTVAGNDDELTYSIPFSRPVQTIVSKPVFDSKAKRTDLSSIKVGWTEVDGDKTGYCLSIHEPDGPYIEGPREINIKSEGLIYGKILSNSYQEEFNGLVPGRRYEIRAFTRSGHGKSDTTSMFVQTEVSPVQNISVEPSQSATGLTVKWDPVFGDVDNYSVALETSSGKEIDQANVKEATHTFDNLTPGAKYQVRVKSYNN
ncbi:tenascin-N-like [Branchiostoma floridae x Branchiostoma japonicum]